MAGEYLRGYGWKPQLPDLRDRQFNRPSVAALPAKVDLRPNMPAVYDQGQLNSCTANAIAGAIEYEKMRQVGPAEVPSRLFIWYNERALEGTISSDVGAYLRDGMKAVNTEGACPESIWPYEAAMFAHHPPKRCYSASAKDLALQYEAIQTLNDLKSALSLDLAVAFGFTVYESFESQAVANTGIMPMPQAGERQVGGHAVLAVGYDDAATQVICRNSWAVSWGIQGYFYMPYEYLTGPGKVNDASVVNGGHMASDFWAIEQVGAH